MSNDQARQAEHDALEAMWSELRRTNGASTAVRATIVRWVRARAAVWETAGEIELAGECHSIGDAIEGRAVGFRKVGQR